MKKILALAVIISMIACNDGSVSSTGSAGPLTKAEKQEEKKITVRDYTINESNAYSSLSFDSTVMEAFIKDKAVSNPVARRLRSFYNARNYHYAWFSPDGLTEQARAFWNLHNYVTSYDIDTSLRDKTLQHRMDGLIAEDSLAIEPADRSYTATELTLTQHFIEYALNNYEKGYVKRKELERFIPTRKEDVLAFADSLLNKKHRDEKYFEDINQPYKALKAQLAKYYDIAKNGGWQPVTTAQKTLKKGNKGDEIIAVKKRLALTGNLAGTDSSATFNDTLETAVKEYQISMGYKPDGIVTPTLIKDMNVPALQRVEQIVMNMNRMRWMPEAEKGALIVVNIPEFELHVYEGAEKLFDMDIVVGKEGKNTNIFTGNLNQIVFSPYWNVPASIVKSEILPGMKRNRNYLASHHMEQTGTSGGLPVIRQTPGAWNSLGRVKFLFPNSFDIYFHDTNAKGLFSQDKRAYSHGCIRLAEPEKMAQYLLKNDPAWTPEKIEEAMNSGEQKYVKLAKPVPVLISYSTAWVDDDGRMNFRDDIYSHDKALAEKMFIEQ